MRILAVCSGGGHWVQMKRLLGAFDGHELSVATVSSAYRVELPDVRRFHVVRDATRWDRVGLVVLSFQMLWVLLRDRPRIVVSTGAAPGFIALRLGKLLGRKTIWVDSIANVERLSMSGRLIGPYADLWLTQWPELANPDDPATPRNRKHPNGPTYEGAVF